MPELGAIADDFTGATDLATNLVTSGFRTVVTVGVPHEPIDADAVVVALRTRTAAPSSAVLQSLEALDALQHLGCARFYLKYCSTFDSTPSGNIGPVADALLEALHAPAAVVVPAFPDNRRTVYQGVLFADGLPLAESSMARHPLTPMTDSDVTRLLAPQTRHAVGLVRHEVVRQGPAAVRLALDRHVTEGHRLVVVDALDDDDLRTIAAATTGDRLVTGGSGLALGMHAERQDRDGGLRRLPAVPNSPRAVLVGSASAASRRQVAHARRRLPSRRLDVAAVTSDPAPVVARLVAWAQEQWAEAPSRPILVHSVDEDAETRGARVDPRVADAIETAFAELARRFAGLGVRRFVIGGGETSGQVTAALGITALTIGPDIAPGVAWAHGRVADDDEDPGYLVALKSGNFGADDFFTTAWDALA